MLVENFNFFYFYSPVSYSTPFFCLILFIFVFPKRCLLYVKMKERAFATLIFGLLLFILLSFVEKVEEETAGDVSIIGDESIPMGNVQKQTSSSYSPPSSSSSSSVKEEYALALDRLLDAKVVKSPYHHVYVEQFVPPYYLKSINEDFPESLKHSGHVEDHVLREGNEIKGSFKKFLDQMASVETRRTLEKVFSVDLSKTFIRTTMRGLSIKEDGRVHQDDVSKKVTALVYLSEKWPHAGDGGKLRLLTKRDINSNITVANDAAFGNLLAFLNPAAQGDKTRGFHGYSRLIGERRTVQINYQTRIKVSGPEEKKKRYIYPADKRIRSGKYELPSGIRLAVE